MEFQSLFYWNCRLILIALSFISTLNEVSILILLELPFDLSIYAITAGIDGFQSLFYWNCRLIRLMESQQQSSQVSILILLELPFDKKQAGIAHWGGNSFNPYFIGIAV